MARLRQGNPLFIEEVLKSLFEKRDIFTNDKGQWERRPISKIEIPQNIVEVIRQRLQRLDRETREVLRTASVIGESFDFDFLEKVLHEIKPEELHAQTEKALKSRLVFRLKTDSKSVVGSRYFFSDESVREVLYGELNPIKRQDYHLRVAQILEQTFSQMGSEALGQHSANLAFHFQLGGSAAKALEQYIIAGKNASELYAHHVACRHFEEALKILSGTGPLHDELVKKGEVLEQLAIQKWYLGQSGDTVKYWTETAKLYEDLGDKIRAGSFWSKLGLMYHLGAYDKVNALASYERAKSLLDNGTSDGSLSDVLMNLSVIKFWDGDVGGGSELLEEAMILSKKSKVFETESMGYQLVAGFPFSMKNQALESIDKGLQLALEHDYFQIASYGYFHRAVFNVLVRGASKDAERLFVEGLEYASKVGFSPIELWLTSMLVSEVYSRLGYWDKANEIATKLYESVTSMPAAPSLVRLIGTVTLGCLLVNRGDS